MDDLCVNCGHLIDYVRAFAGAPSHWVHRNGRAVCENVLGTFACPAAGAVG